MADPIVPRDVQVRLTSQARDYAYGKLGLDPYNSNPDRQTMDMIVKIGDRKYGELRAEWIEANVKKAD